MGSTSGFGPVECDFSVLIFAVDTIDEQHVKVHIEIERAAKALD